MNFVIDGEDNQNHQTEPPMSVFPYRHQRFELSSCYAPSSNLSDITNPTTIAKIEQINAITIFREP